MKALRAGLPTTHTTPFNRLIGLSIGLVHAPTMVIATLLALLGSLSVVLIPLMLLLYLPDLLLYIGAWRIYLDRLSRSGAKRIWKGTMVFNTLMILATGVFYLMIGLEKGWVDTLSLLTFVPGHMVRALLAAMAYRDLLKHEGAEKQPNPTGSQLRFSEEAADLAEMQGLGII